MNNQDSNFNFGNLNLGTTANNTAKAFNSTTNAIGTQVGNTTKVIGNKVGNIRNQFGTLSTTMKVLSIIVVILFLVFIGYTVYSFGKDFYDSYNNEPFLVKGTKLGKHTMIIPGHKAPPSVDQRFGAEFSYAMWIYITDYTYKQNEWKHILHKGSQTAMPLQAPGIWLYPKENKIAINMNTFHSVKESCDIGNIPVGKWFHLTVVVVGKYLDVYINGRLKKRCQFKGVPKQNYGDIYINQWQGFDGFLSNVRYFANALPFYRIEQLVKDGPSQESCIDDAGTTPPYLAPDWWERNGFGRQEVKN